MTVLAATVISTEIHDIWFVGMRKSIKHLRYTNELELPSIIARTMCHGVAPNYLNLRKHSELKETALEHGQLQKLGSLFEQHIQNLAKAKV